MKQKHSSKILQFAANFASRESAFILAIIGVLSQAAHTTYITYHLSSLDGAWKLIQAAMMALFFNGALLYFVLKGESGSETQRKRYMKLVYLFAGLEVFMNLYYWSQKFIIESWPDASWDKLIIALPMAFILPITLAMYSYEVRVEDFTDENDSGLSTDTNLQDDMLEQLKQQLASQLSKQYDEKIAQTIQEMIPLHVSHIDLGINSKIESELSKYHENKFDLIFDSKQNVGETKVLKDVTIKPSSENSDNFETPVNEHDAIFSESGITPSEPSSETDEIEESDNVIHEHTEPEQDKSENTGRYLDTDSKLDTDSELNIDSESKPEPKPEPEQEPSSKTDSAELEQTNNPETKLFEYQEK